MTKEADNCNELRGLLAADFDTFVEVPVRHALFRRRSLRIDLLAIPKADHLRDIALGFEVKGHDEWNIPSLAHCLKQASDYVLATVEPELPEHVGKRVMAVFVYPAPDKVNVTFDDVNPTAAFYSGMVHMAGYYRVGSAKISSGYREKPLTLSCPDEVWVSSRGWRSNARNILVGKRQIGSQRFPILEELSKL